MFSILCSTCRKVTGMRINQNTFHVKLGIKSTRNG